MDEFSIATTYNSIQLREAGFVLKRAYSTVRCGRVETWRVPTGTQYLECVHPPGSDFRATARYRLPNGQTFVAGGGGPSTLDVLRLEDDLCCIV